MKTTLKLDGADLVASAGMAGMGDINISANVRIWRERLTAALSPDQAQGWQEDFAMMDEIDRWIEAAKQNRGKWKKWAMIIGEKLGKSGRLGPIGQDGHKAHAKLFQAFAWMTPATERDEAAIEALEIV
jgi:hypothetical protein